MSDQAPDPIRDPEAAPPLAIVLAGGRGARLHELTDRSPKAALPFVRRRRIVDFTMENIARSGLPRALVITQYLSDQLKTYLQRAWSGRMGGAAGLILANGTTGTGASEGYDGTADALWQNAAQIDASGARDVLILSADHVYEMDYRPLIAAHRASGASMTLAVTAADHQHVAQGLAVVEARRDGVITRLATAPDLPAALPDTTKPALASIGVFICDWAWLRAQLAKDAQAPDSRHDFDHDIVPIAVRDGVASTFLWQTERGRAVFWRAISTLDTLREAALLFETGDAPCALPSPDLGSVEPSLSRFGMSTTVGGLRLFAPLRSRDGRADWGVVEASVLMEGARLSPGCRLTRALIAPGVTLPEGLVVGEDPAEDRRWFRVTPTGTTLVTTQMLSRRAALMPRRFGGIMRGLFGQTMR
ncbi:MAG: sugar phosphate nucleotidyltransferase [Pseudotabrizicola sp.]|uniref:sugar phosphate nucleotidyltransferase n=1 Tax=Pseudotabrizicola sp. TaxID=2939647 RepID=UPI0027279365|nr:sugar phosphate nucleotidyltransferase [Pseudotabrizicola sp.]MDO8883811.1 sugar phosphate nucleotidyltransferase [Pseudotabrizicola sp.]MDP2079768.1 sugar phosphate nucleotidyltransferase [Pseudotabrizicola sp.]MDZ7574769.1 sugar phosphate nucleotidyltransferase [Pseudotabrizicola sp.]